MQDEFAAGPVEYPEDTSGPPIPSIDFVGILAAAFRRWKLIGAIALAILAATYGALRFVPSVYRSTVEILVFDPQQEINAAVQKPISPFVDALGYEAMQTEISIIKSKSVALRVAKELGLDRDPEYQPHSRLAELVKLLGFRRTTRDNIARNTDNSEEEKAVRTDQAADALREQLEVSSESYIITISATSHDPANAQRVASTVATDYLASQRDARQEALQRAATWLRSRLNDLQSHALGATAAIEKLKAQSAIRDSSLYDISEKQITELNDQLTRARMEVDWRRARLEEARHAIHTGGDIQNVQRIISTPNGILGDVKNMQRMISTPNDVVTVPELTASTELTEMRQKQVELNWRASILRDRLGDRHAAVLAVKTQLAGLNKQIKAEAEHILDNMRSAYDIAVRQEQTLDAELKRMTAVVNSATYAKLQRLQRATDTDHQLYQSYLSQYNEIAQQRTLQNASARIISPASLPRSPTRSHRKFYAIGGGLGLGFGFLIAFLIEYLQPGVKGGAAIEHFFGRPVVGSIPLVQTRKSHSSPHDLLLRTVVDEPFSHFSEAVHAIRIGLECSCANSKVILITSALPAEGKSTAAMLLAASSASAGKRTVLLDCDLRRQSLSKTFRHERQPGLSELLRGAAELMDVITIDPTTNSHIISAGSAPPTTADFLMSQRMQDLIAELRGEFDYIVMDTPPLLAVVDALALATVADKVLVVVEWGQTPLVSVYDAFKVMRVEAHRIAGIVLNKVDLRQLQGYGYRSCNSGTIGKYFSNA